MTVAEIQEVEVDGRTVAYREAGSGPAVLLIHGWPTSSYLWRDAIAAIGERNRAIAIDLPGFGGSDKPLQTRYGFELFEAAIDGLLQRLEVERVGLAVHDLGGPVGVHWTLGNRDRVTKLALLNTLVYPEFSAAVQQFLHMCTDPELREQLTSPEGLEAGMRLGLADQERLTEESLAAVREPFQTTDARRALADAGIGLDPAGFVEIAEHLSELQIPVTVVYGEQDRILPDVAETMARVKRDLPQAKVTSLPDAGHFCQEEAGVQIGRQLAEFFGPE